jgi:hypothetical protein
LTRVSIAPAGAARSAFLKFPLSRVFFLRLPTLPRDCSLIAKNETLHEHAGPVRGGLHGSRTVQRTL